jgi:hypothetical protein
VTLAVPCGRAHPHNSQAGADMDWELLPGVGLAWARLGESRTAIRHRLGESRTFRRTPTASETDQFPETGVLVTYTGDVVSLTELTAPAAPTVLGVGLLGRRLEEVLNDLRASGINVVPDADGAIVQEWSLGLYAPTGMVEGVSVGE